MNTQASQPTYVAFLHGHIIRSGQLLEVLAAIKLSEDPIAAQTLIFDNESGAQIDFDMRGTLDEVLTRVKAMQRYAEQAALASAAARAGGAAATTGASGQSRAGRPKLGVESREVGLLPRHWEWLAKQSKGASATLRLIVENEMRREKPEQFARARRDAAYKIMAAVAGNKENFEEASRALFAGNIEKFDEHIATWPVDIRNHLKSML